MLDGESSWWLLWGITSSQPHVPADSMFTLLNLSLPEVNFGRVRSSGIVATSFCLQFPNFKMGSLSLSPQSAFLPHHFKTQNTSSFCLAPQQLQACAGLIKKQQQQQSRVGAGVPGGVECSGQKAQPASPLLPATRDPYGNWELHWDLPRASGSCMVPETPWL